MGLSPLRFLGTLEWPGLVAEPGWWGSGRGGASPWPEALPAASRLSCPQPGSQATCLLPEESTAVPLPAPVWGPSSLSWIRAELVALLPPCFPSPLRWYLGPPRGLCLQMGPLWGSLCLLMDVTRVPTAGEWAVHFIALSPHSPLGTGLLWRCPSPGELSHGPQRHRPCTHPLPCQEGRGGRCPFRGTANFTVH